MTELGIVSYGSYVPYWRLRRGAISDALGGTQLGGARSVASFDEDSTSMGVEASRRCLTAAPPAMEVRSLYFATSEPAYRDKTNASTVHAALGLDASVPAFDFGGSVRSGFGALMTAHQAGAPSLVALSDMRSGLPGSIDEIDGGDGAAAFLFSDREPICRVLGYGHRTAELLDRWRLPKEDHSHTWEERFGEQVYVPLATEALGAACKAAGVSRERLDELLVASVHERAARALVKSAPVDPAIVRVGPSPSFGNSGTAHAGLLLASALDNASPGSLIALVQIADGADAVIIECTDTLAEYRARQAPTLEASARASRDVDYITFLTWRDRLDREPPRRPDTLPPVAPAAWRNRQWKFGLNGSRCSECSTRHLPPARVCVRCGSVDRMDSESFVDVPGSVATFTIDHLAYTPSPPMIAAVVDFDGGGRLRCELTDLDAEDVHVGTRVRMTFRRLSTAKGIRNYFWKARPLHESEE